jgi:hypothetical protein
MTRDDFVKQAIASGKPKDEIRKVYNSIEAAGEFDDQQQPPQQPRYLQRLGNAEKENANAIGRENQAIADRTTNEVNAMRGTPLAGPMQALSGYKGAFQMAGNTLGGAFNAVIGAPISSIFSGNKPTGTPYSQQQPDQSAQVVGAPYYMSSAPGPKETAAAENIVAGIDKRLSPDVKSTINAAVGLSNLAGIGPGAKGAIAAKDIATSGAKDAAEATGAAIENTGKAMYRGEAKFKDSIVKPIRGSTVNEKKQNAMNDVVEFGLHNEKSFGQGSQKAYELRDSKLTEADDITKAADQTPDINAVLEIRKAGENALGKYAAAGEKKAYEDKIESIVNDVVDKFGYKKLSLDDVVEVKKFIKSKSTFDKGAGIVVQDPIDATVRKAMYLKLVDQIAQKVPEAAKLNRDAKRLWDVGDVLDAVAARTENKHMIGTMTDLGIGASAAIPALQALGTGDFEHAAMLAAAGGVGIAMRKLFSEGKLAGKIINVGKGLKSISGKDAESIIKNSVTSGNIKELRKTIPETESNPIPQQLFQEQGGGTISNAKENRILGNQRGSVGSENPQINTNDFKRFFGDSKTVDKNGKPIVYYHGTMNKFSKFDPSMIGSSNKGEGAYFLTSDKEAAGEYATMHYSGSPKERPSIIPAYVKLENPYISDLKQYSVSAVTKEIQKAKAAGNDGIMFPKMKGFGEQGQIAVFSPNQIKSSIGNKGTFNINNSDLRAASGIGTLGSIVGTGIVGLTGAATLAGLSKNKKGK